MNNSFIEENMSELVARYVEAACKCRDLTAKLQLIIQQRNIGERALSESLYFSRLKSLKSQHVGIEELKELRVLAADSSSRVMHAFVTDARNQEWGARVQLKEAEVDAQGLFLDIITLLESVEVKE